MIQDDPLSFKVMRATYTGCSSDELILQLRSSNIREVIFARRNFRGFFFRFFLHFAGINFREREDSTFLGDCRNEGKLTLH